jgi:tryptophan synthase alpha subunit
MARTKPPKKSSRTKAVPLAPLAPPRSKSATVIVYSRPSGYWYAQALDATTGARITDASGYSREDVLRALRGKFAMIGVTIRSIDTL